MERKTARTAKTAAPAPAKGRTSASRATGAKTTAKTTAAPKGRTTAAKGSRGTAKGATAAKRTPAKTAAPTTRATGPTPDRIRLAGEVAKLRRSGAKWNEIAATTGKSEPTLAKLRKDVRAGVFANVSPVSARVASDAF
jgi:hypothetical protein